MNKALNSIINQAPKVVKAAQGDRNAQLQLASSALKLVSKTAKNQRKRQRQKEKNKAQTALSGNERNVAGASIAQPLAWGSQFRTVKPVSSSHIRTIDGQRVSGTLVKGSELLEFVYSPTNYTGGYVVQPYEFAPRFGVLALLDSMALPFKRYQTDVLALKFYPFLPTTSAGRMGLYASADPSSPPPVSFHEFLRYTQQQTANVYSEIALQISPNSTGSYLPGVDSTLDAANIRQTFTCQMGYAFEAPASTTPVQIGAVIVAYEFFFWDLIDPTQVINPGDYMLTMNLPTGANVQNFNPWAPFWLKSKTTPGLFKYLGSQQLVDVQIQGTIAGDHLITDYLPNLLNSDGTTMIPVNIFDSVIAYSDVTFVNANTVAANGSYELKPGSLLRFPSIVLPADLKVKVEFSYLTDTPKSIFDF